MDGNLNNSKLNGCRKKGNFLIIQHLPDKGKWQIYHNYNNIHPADALNYGDITAMKQCQKKCNMR